MVLIMLISEDKTLDKRIKLLDEDKENIIFLKQEYDYSIRFLAKVYGVSRTRIQHILYPEKRRLYLLSYSPPINRKKTSEIEKKSRERRKLLKEKGIL